jgi:hypothetical protein
LYYENASEGFCEDLARQNTVAIYPSSSYGFGVVTYGFQSSPWCPKGHYLGRCTVCLGTSAYRPCFDLSVCLQLVCPSLFCPSDWLANPIACASFPASPSLFVDSLDSKLWYRSGCRATALASSSTLAVGQSFGSFSPRGARSKGDQQPDGRVAHNQKLQNILGVDIGILATQVLRARKTRKSNTVQL